MQKETLVVTAPAAWASYLINGDASVFDYSNDLDDEKACYELENKYGVCVDAVEVGFITSPDFGLAGDCCEYTFFL